MTTRVVAGVLLAALLMAAGAALAYRFWFSPEVSRLTDTANKANTALKVEQMAHAGTLASLQEQRLAVAALREEGAKREAGMRAAMDAANQAARRADLTAQRILASKPSLPDVCEAARLEFDQQLTQERAAQ